MIVIGDGLILNRNYYNIQRESHRERDREREREGGKKGRGGSGLRRELR